MAKVSPIQSNFNGGEITPLLYGRPDIDKYKSGLKTCLNFVPLIQGPVERRPGTVHITEVFDSSKSTRIFRFEFSITQAYIVEFGDLYFRVIKDNGLLVTTPTKITTTYAEADLFQLKFSQSADVLYIAHKSYVPRKLQRTSGTTFTISDVVFSDGPFLNTNIETTTLTLSGGAYTKGATGVTVTAGSPTTTISGATQANPVVVTDTAHGYSDGTVVQILAVAGMTELNGNFYIVANKNNNDFELQDLSGVDIDGTGFSAYSSGGTASVDPRLGVNGGTGFKTTDVGRLIRWQDAATNWTWFTITAFTSTTVVTVTITGPTASAATGTVNWRLGVWSATTGYPSAVTFHQNRLAWGGGVDTPQRVDISRSGDFENMAPTEADATVVADNAIAITLSADNVNAIRWMADDEKGLIVGTSGGEWVLRPSETGGVLAPATAQAKRSSSFGSADITPVRVGRALLFVQRAARKLRELAYVFEDDGFRAPDMTVIAEHLTQVGIVEMAYQAEPQSVVWVVLTDGTLLGFTYDREQQITGWHRHVVGGVSDAAGTQAKVESVAVIPNAAGTADEVYIVVQRYINGATVRFIEYMKPFWKSTNDHEDAFFVDSGLTLDNPVTVTGITAANPPVVTAATHGFSNGDSVKLASVLGMTEVNDSTYKIGEVATNTFELFVQGKIAAGISGITKADPAVVTAVAHGLSAGEEILILNVTGMTEVNGVGYMVANPTADTFELESVNSTSFTTYTLTGDIHHAVNATAFTTYVSAGVVRKRVSTVSGLSHLEGETVSILSEGAAHADKVVTSGVVTFDRDSTKAHVGLGYNSDFETLRPNEGAKDGTSQGKLIRIHRVVMRFFQFLGGSIGPDTSNLDTVVIREGGDSMDTAVPLYDGDLEFEWDGEYTTDNHIFYRQSQPLPVTIEVVMPQLSTQDR
jgi:hypothetical protein